jgi:hypothetical protein
MHASTPGAHGSPMPDSLQMGHFSVRHDSTSLRAVTLPWYLPLQPSMQALTPAPAQASTQLNRLLHSVEAVHALRYAQQLALTHAWH